MDVDTAEEGLFNPHDDAEPFFRPILRGRLAPSLNRLVTLLRETLPIVTELEAIRREEEKANRVVDAYPKAAGWYRLLYGDLRYNISHYTVATDKLTLILGML
jgi:mediator of RNA polymerase II transcription subunit 14